MGLILAPFGALETLWYRGPMQSHDGRSETVAAKKAYSSPKLTHLGSVRDLTFGPSGSHADASLGKKSVK